MKKGAFLPYLEKLLILPIVKVLFDNIPLTVLLVVALYFFFWYMVLRKKEIQKRPVATAVLITLTILLPCLGLIATAMLVAPLAITSILHASAIILDYLVFRGLILIIADVVNKEI